LEQLVASLLASSTLLQDDNNLFHTYGMSFSFAEESTFSLDCLHHYDGDIIIHVGELYGETFSNNPWGQSTSRIFQLELGKTFRCVYRRRLPSWPGYMDSLSIWCKIGVAVDCDGGMFCHVPGFETVGLK
jgi:hypothetical protein